MLYGIIEYEDEKYIYNFTDGLLCMEVIDYLGKAYMIPEWLSNPPNFRGEYLRGVNAENGNIILFKTYPGNAGFKNTQIRVRIQYYIELKKELPINKISIMGDEINYIYDIGQGLESYEFGEEGKTSCKTKTFEETTSTTEYFDVENKKVGIYFTIYRGINFKSCTPLNLHSAINLLFDGTEDYDFMVHLCYLLKKFLGFMCYRKNVNLDKIDIYTKNSDDKFEKVGKIIFLDENKERETEKIVKERNITYESIEGSVGKIIQDIEEEKLYLRHLPDSHKDGLKLDHSKFIMITAAIEWMFKNIYPDGLQHSEKTLKAQEQVKADLRIKVEETTGEIKKQYKFLQRLVGSDSLSQKIVQIGKGYETLIGEIGRYLYSINDLVEEFDYLKIGSRIENQRNNFAHGNLDKEFEDNAVLDLLYLEKIIYLLQLNLYDIENKVAIEQVKRLFGMRF